MEEYVARVNAARVHEVARVTPLERLRKLSDVLGATVLLKREDEQEIHSFKIRGAYNKMCRLSKAELSRGVLAASAGNHAQGVAMSAGALGCKATIVMPESAPRLKVEAVRDLGAEVVLAGETFSDAAAEAERLVAERGVTFVPPYDDPDVIAGQGTVAKEILEQCPTVDSIFVPIGGGGFAAGVAAYVKGVRPAVRVYGVEPVDSDCMYRSIAAGRLVTVEHPGLFADGVCVKTPGVETFRICRVCLDGIVRVTMAETCDAIADIFNATRTVCEPAGALALAAVKKTARRGETCAAILSGANMNFDSLNFISAVASMDRLREDICRDGKVDFDETTRLVERLRPFVEPDRPTSALFQAVTAARADGVITAEESARIISLMDAVVNRQMTTSAARAEMMG